MPLIHVPPFAAEYLSGSSASLIVRMMVVVTTIPMTLLAVVTGRRAATTSPVPPWLKTTSNMKTVILTRMSRLCGSDIASRADTCDATVMETVELILPNVCFATLPSVPSGAASCIGMRFLVSHIHPPKYLRVVASCNIFWVAELAT